MFHFHTGHTEPHPSSQGEKSTAKRWVKVEPRSLPFRPCSRSQDPRISCLNGLISTSRAWVGLFPGSFVPDQI